jgi:hypothetical protein
MKRYLPILVLVCSAWCHAGDGPQQVVSQTSNAASPEAAPAPAIPVDQENARKAKAAVDQGIQALGGEIYLNIRDREQQGRGYSFHHGRPTSNGVLFWGFTEFPDKERVEYTKERDIARVYVGTQAMEITYKGAHPIEEKDRVDYMRLRQYSLDVVLRSWVKDPGVIFLYEGNAIAAQHPAVKVTLINAKNESVSLFFDVDTHLPIKKTFEWRDPVDRQKNLEEEIYENYRAVSGIMAPYNVTRYFNGDMAAQRFMNLVTINQGLDQAMFDPNSGYNPNKAPGKR